MDTCVWVRWHPTLRSRPSVSASMTSMLGKIQYDNLLMQLCPSAGGEKELSAQTKTFKIASLKYRKVEGLEKDPMFRAYIQHSMFRDITAKIIGDEISVYRSMFFNKPAGRGIAKGWHQDGANGWNMNITPVITIWTALDPTSIANGCLQIIPRSHTRAIPEKGDSLTPEEAAIHAPDEKRLYLEMEMGEVVLLHNFTLHQSDANTTDRPRRGFSVCYVDAATRHLPTGYGYPGIFPEYIPVEGKAAEMVY